MYQIDTAELDKSFQRKGLYAEKVVQDKASFLHGKSKVLNYLLQDAPSGDSLPVFVIPVNEKFMSLVSFMVLCDRNFECPRCFQRNECLRKVLRNIQNTLCKMNQRRLTIDEVLNNYSELRRTPRLEVALDLVIELFIAIGEIE